MSTPSWEKSTFALLFLMVAVLLMVMPFVTTFNDLLTRLVEKVEIYRAIQNFVVPYEVKLISVILNLFGIKTVTSAQAISMAKDGGWERAYISWNCVGWQSLILYLVTLFAGLVGPYTKTSKAEVIIIGFLGTFLVNIFRLSLVYLFLYFFGYYVGILIFHDYISNLMIIAWLFFFWWFSYSFVLRTKHANLSE